MATMAEAFAEVDQAALERATRDGDPLSLGEVTRRHLRHLIATVRRSYPKITQDEAEEATGEALVRIVEKASKLDPTRSPWGAVVQNARWILQEGFTERKRLRSIEGLYASSGDAAFYHARPARPDAPTMRFDLDMQQKELAERLIAFRDREGRPPTAAECDADPDLPSSTTLRTNFGNFNQALLAAGLTPVQLKRRVWTKEEAIDVLLRYRRYYGAFPTSGEIIDDPDLPATMTMRRFFGSTSPRKYGPQIEAAV